MKRVGFENEFELAGTLLILGIEKIKYVFTIDMLVLSIWSFKCPGGLAHCIDDFGERGLGLFPRRRSRAVSLSRLLYSYARGREGRHPVQSPYSTGFRAHHLR